ncbi:peroxynitrite isomerase THAP4 isoform X1 [Xylocopa sonorina]|uniref:peroxynitrite isomerase THAP4 isoform X1 n=2 Tax=Xylocopa sonorina TaxID=1818115 RepID=UPI00403AEA60
MQSTSNINRDMKQLAIHEVVKPLAWLRGTWRTKSPGAGKFPTIKPFAYCEEVIFSSIGQPMLNYSARSWNADTKKPMHYEVGFLKVVPNTKKVHLLLSHNFGVTTIEEGVFEDKLVKLKTTHVARPTESQTQSRVIELQRNFELVGDCLQHTLYMATETTPELQEHLRATYVKYSEETDAQDNKIN